MRAPDLDLWSQPWQSYFSKIGIPFKKNVIAFAYLCTDEKRILSLLFSCKVTETSISTTYRYTFWTESTLCQQFFLSLLWNVLEIHCCVVFKNNFPQILYFVARRFKLRNKLSVLLDWPQRRINADCYMAEILPIRCKSPINQSINQSIN